MSQILELKDSGYLTRDEFTFHLRHASEDHIRTLERMLEADRDQAGDYLLRERLKARACPDGTVYLSESGRDCDGVQYWGQIHTLQEPTVEAFNALADDINQWADGPFYLTILWPDEVEEARANAGQRDLVAEAYEDGHPHVIYG